MKYVFIITIICLFFFSLSWMFPPKTTCTGVITGGACSLEDLGYHKKQQKSDTEFNQKSEKKLLPLNHNAKSLDYTLCEIGNCKP